MSAWPCDTADFIRARLDHFITERCTTRAALAAALNVSRGTITHWLAGRALPRTELLIAACDALQVPMTEFWRPFRRAAANGNRSGQ